jgi:hypothetical protein
VGFGPVWAAAVGEKDGFEAGEEAPVGDVEAVGSVV